MVDQWLVHLRFEQVPVLFHSCPHLKPTPDHGGSELCELMWMSFRITEKPGMTDLKGKAKWEAWNGRKGLSKDEAKTQYIAKSKEF